MPAFAANSFWLRPIYSISERNRFENSDIHWENNIIMSFIGCKYLIMGVYYIKDIIMSFAFFSKKGVCYEKKEKNERSGNDEKD